MGDEMAAAPPRRAGGRGSRGWRRGLGIGGGVLGLAAFAWMFWTIDFTQLAGIVREADLRFLIVVPVAIAGEQLVRAWKWRQLLHPMVRIGSLRLFGAIMAGYLANILIPIGLSSFVRSWLVARRTGTPMSTVFATVALDRLTDGVVFMSFVPLVTIFAVFPDPGGTIRLAMILGGAGSLLVLVALLAAMFARRERIARLADWALRPRSRVPEALARRAQAVMQRFSKGIAWPGETWRGAGIVLASAVIKLIAASHFLWAGLAIGVVLPPMSYFFLLVFFGFLVVITYSARIPGGFIVGAVFALGLLGVGEEQALAMVLIVITANMAVIAVLGVAGLWSAGVSLGDLRSQRQAVADTPLTPA